MVETIIGILVASGVLGLGANYIVSGAKKLRNLGIRQFASMNPKVYAACASLFLVVVTTIAGGDADVNQVGTYLEVIATALVTWSVAHFTHKSNSV